MVDLTQFGISTDDTTDFNPNEKRERSSFKNPQNAAIKLGEAVENGEEMRGGIVALVAEMPYVSGLGLGK